MIFMLDSAIAQENEIKDALQAKGESQCIDFSMLKQFTAFLQPLKVATKLLEGELFPTIPQVALQKEQESPAVADKPARRLRKVCTVYVRAVGL